MLLQIFQAVLTDTFCEKPYFIYPEIRLNVFRKRNFFFAGRLFTNSTVEMKMPVIMHIFITSIVAKLVFCSRIFLNTVYDAFFLEGF